MRIHTLLWDDVATVVGTLDDGRVAAIIASGASIEDIRQATTLLNDANHRPPTGSMVAKVYSILTATETMWNER